MSVTGGSLALLNGREKLNVGRERRLPGVDLSEPTDGDRGMACCASGDTGELENPLLEENFRDSVRKEAPIERG